jgi:hypothetical protein
LQRCSCEPRRAGYPADKLFKLLQRRGNCRLRLGQASLALVDLQQALALVNERVGQVSECSLGTPHQPLRVDTTHAPGIALQDASLAPVKAQITKEVDQMRRNIAGEKKAQKGEPRRAATAQPSPPMDNPRIAHASSAVAIQRSPEVCFVF